MPSVLPSLRRRRRRRIALYSWLFGAFGVAVAGVAGALVIPGPLAAQGAPTPPAASGAKPPVPEWAYPGTATRRQVAPPPDFRRPSTHYQIPLGVFEGQSDIGTAAVPGTASFDAAAGRYTVTSAGYDIWYYRDEFRLLCWPSGRRGGRA